MYCELQSKQKANTVEDIVYLRTFRPSTGVIINALMLRQFSGYAIVIYTQ